MASRTRKTAAHGCRGTIFAAILAVTSHAAAQPPTLDLEQIIALAIERNERSLQAEVRHDVAAARLGRARSFFLPDFLATGSYTRRAYETVRTVDGDPVTIQSRDALFGSVSFSLPIFDARSFPLYVQAAREEDAARLQATEDKRRIAFEAADAFLVAIGLEQVQAAAERRLEYARGSLQDARARFDAGLVSSNDVSRAELELASAERVLAEAQAGVQTAYLQLGNLLDVEVAPPLAPPTALLDSASQPAPDPEPAIASAQQRRLDVAASRERTAALRSSAREPLFRTIPSLSFDGLARFTNEQGFSGRDHDWSLGLDVNWELYDGGERYSERDERNALARIAELDTQALLREVDLEVRRARVALERSQATTRAATAAVEAAQRNAAETTELYRQGLARALEVADASVSLFESEVALVGERFGLGRAFLGWRAALGFDPLGREP